MSREIKFRGMTIEGKMVFGQLSILNKKYSNVGAGMYISNSAGAPFAYQVRPETIGQYTGLKDHDDKEIYENDILLLEHDTRHKFGGGYSRRKHHAVVKYGNNGKGIFTAGYHCYFQDAIGEVSSRMITSLSKNDFKIIGNVYENPELLQSNDC